MFFPFLRLSLFRQFSNPQGEADTLGNIGKVYLEQGRPADALTAFQTTLSVFERIGNPLGEATARANVGAAYVDERRTTEALEQFQKARAMFVSIGVRDGRLTAVEEMIEQLTGGT